MEDLQKAWGTFLTNLFSSIAELWGRFARGVLHDWDIRIFIFGMAVILLTGLFTIWKKKI